VENSRVAGNLLALLAEIPDPRGRHGRRHPLAAMLAAIVCGILTGAQGYRAIAQWARAQHATIGPWLGFQRRPPCANSFRNLLLALDPEVLESVLRQWIEAVLGKPLPEALAGVSLDGKTHPLPEPFLVVATQNPQDFAGTFPLPESQLDRFMMRIRIGYPPPQVEMRLMLEPDHDRIQNVPVVLDPQTLVSLQREVDRVTTDGALGESLGATDVFELRPRIGFASSGSTGWLRTLDSW